MFIDIDSEEFERKYLIQRLSTLDAAVDGAKSVKALAAVLAPYYVIGKVADGDSEAEQEESFVIVPWTRFSRQMPALECNYRLIQQLTLHYEVDLYNVYVHGDLEWWKNIPKNIVDAPHISLLEASKVPASLAKSAGIVKYVGNLSKIIKRLIKELNEKHERKRKLLSNSLRK
ncbi:hypothetical protein [Mesorhizobium argentiipisi]|uniref:Uncharacterized protein n=1 Tax=Mesorhizobium argentiipisi TaxID=3015175 RepID=A0ABU8K5L5_9HYPH